VFRKTQTKLYKLPDTKILMRKKSAGKKTSSIIIITNLLLSIIAFSMMIASTTEIVSGQGTTTPMGRLITVPTVKLPLADISATQPTYLAKEIFSFSETTKGTAGFFDAVAGSGLDAALGGLMWAGVAYGAGQLIGSLLGLEKEQTQALSLSLAAGVGVGKFVGVIFGKGGAGLDLVGGQGISQTSIIGAPGIGIVVAVVVFALTYKDTSEKTVIFECNPWDQPKGGTNCELCNKDSNNFPCTEYKCKSLGAACELLNAGTGNEKCSWVNKNDVTSPIISPNYEALTEGYTYKNVRIRPPGIGMELTKENGECIEAFTTIKFGISTNEPTKCSIDYNHTTSIDNMTWAMGGSNDYEYNHTQILSLPGPTNINNEFPEIKNDGQYSMFIRCEDPNGNSNVDEYAVKFCVDKGPDTTPTRIEATSIINNAPVSYNTEKVNMTLYLNEPATCKWSKEDKDYNVMENTMSCVESITNFNSKMLYTCKGTLTGIENRKDNDYYFRCKDQPRAQENERNKNTESYKFTIKGTQPLNIIEIGPNGTIEGGASPVAVKLSIETGNGYNDGDSVCYYSTTQNEKDYVKFYTTESYKHEQTQNLVEGTYTYYYKCLDLGGNTEYNQTTFKVFIDKESPKIVRVKHDSAGDETCGGAGCLRISTNEESTCTYSTTTCNYETNKGIVMPYDNSKEHYAPWDTNNKYYIKCSDKSGNEPLPTECSIIIKAYNEK